MLPRPRLLVPALLLALSGYGDDGGGAPVGPDDPVAEQAEAAVEVSRRDETPNRHVESITVEEVAQSLEQGNLDLVGDVPDDDVQPIEDFTTWATDHCG